MLGLGVLTKVTYTVFVGCPMLVYFAFFISKYRHVSWQMLKTLFTAVIGLLIAAPYLYLNFDSIRDQSLLLSSSQLAGLYKMSNPYSLDSYYTFLKTQFNYYMGTIVGLGSIAGLSVVFFNRQKLTSKTKWGVIVLLCWSIPSFFVFGFGHIKDIRYFMPALPSLAIFAALFFVQKRVRTILPLLIFVSLMAVVKPLMKDASSLAVALALLSEKTFGYRTPDTNDWKTSETIVNLQKLLEQNTPGNQNILLLGGQSYYNTALFTYISRMHGNKLEISTLPYYEFTNMTVDDSIKYIFEKNVTAILYKTGDNYPEFSSKNDKEIVVLFEKYPEIFNKKSLQVILPDGSEYWVYFTNLCKYVDSYSPGEKILSNTTYYFDKYLDLHRATIRSLANNYLVSFYWRNDVILPKEYNKFIHLYSSDDTLFAQKDSSFLNCQLKSSATLIKDSFILSAEEYQKTASFRLGVYVPPDASTALQIFPKRNTDWNSTRLVVPLEKFD